MAYDCGGQGDGEAGGGGSDLDSEAGIGFEGLSLVGQEVDPAPITGAFGRRHQAAHGSRCAGMRPMVPWSFGQPRRAAQSSLSPGPLVPGHIEASDSYGSLRRRVAQKWPETRRA